MTNIVAVLIVRCTHTGVYADGRPNPGSVTIYDLDEITIQKNRTRYVPIPHLETVDIPMSTRTFVSWHQGDICKFTMQGLITSEIILQLRDKGDCGGPAGTGQTLRPAVLNIERVGNVLRMVLPDNVIPTTLETLGFLVGEPIAVTGLTGAFRSLNGEYVISTAAPGTGLAGAAVGSYLIEAPSVGADLAAATLAGVNICLTEGRVTAQFNSNGDVGGLGANVYGYIGGQLFPNAGGGAGTVAVFDEGILIDPAVSTFDFIGAGVTVTSAGAGAVDVTIPGGGGAVTLQQAYDNGNTIVTSATSGDLDVSGTEAISLDASMASNFTVDGASLTLATTTSGLVLIDGVDGVEINSTSGPLEIGNDGDTGDINIGTGAAARDITVGNSTGATGVVVNVGSGEFFLNSTVGESDPVATLTSAGANGDSVEFFVGDNDPSGSVTGLAGSLFFRDTGATGELYLNTSAGSGTTWTLISTAGASAVSTTVNQVGHGFSVGEAIYFDGALWQLAQANDSTTLGTHMVTEVIDVDNFVATQAGFVTTFAGLTAGEYYFVSATTAGGLVTTDPSSTNPLFFSNPILLAVSATEAWALPWRAYGPGTSSGGTFVTLFTTVNATPAAGQAISVPTDGVMLIESRVLASEQAPNTDKAAYIRTCRVNVAASTPTVVTTQTDFTSEDDASWDVTFSTAGATVTVVVTGDASNAVDWKIVSTVQVL